MHAENRTAIQGKNHSQKSTQASGVVNTYTYDPYGDVLSASETVENPYRYASYRYDGSTGLYYLWNRYYDSAAYRFITKDIYPGQLQVPATMNGYAYCLGDPMNGVDPSGRSVAAGGGGNASSARSWLWSSRYSVMPSRPDAYDWALLVAGTTGDMALLPVVLGGTTCGGAAAGPGGAAGGGVAGFTAISVYNTVIDSVALGRTFGLWLQNERTLGDLGLAGAAYMPGATTATTAWHITLSTLQAEGWRLYAEPE